MAKSSAAEICLARGLINRQQFDEAIRMASQGGGTTEELLVRNGAVSEEAMLPILAFTLSVPWMKLDVYELSSEIIGLIPVTMARREKSLPVFLTEGRLTVATIRPRDVSLMDRIRKVTGYEVLPVLVREDDLAAAFERYFGAAEEVGEVMDQIDLDELGRGASFFEKALALAETDEEAASVTKLLNVILREALEARATDVHLSPEEDNVHLRYRVDGVLHEVENLPQRVYPALVTRTKVMAQLDIAESRLPQDGRFGLDVDGRNIDIRVSTFPTVHGENIVMRILESSRVLLGVESLGLDEENLGSFKAMISKPHGLILVCGPTGSGKTTTLYAALQSVNTPEKNIITIEDPVEYKLHYIRQSQINPRAGFTFARGLRSVLRHDPDVILVGEIRDTETAETAIQASITGHLVFSTVHTRDTASALARLVDLGVPAGLIAAGVEGFIAQRLVRRICPDCREAYAPSKEDLFKLALLSKAPSPESIFRGRRCNRCRNTGFRGRIGIFELMQVDEELRNLISQGVSTIDLKQRAVQKGMRPLGHDAFAKVLRGTTTLGEALRVTLTE